MTPWTPDPRRGGGAAHEHELLRLMAERHDVQVLSGDLLPEPHVTGLPSVPAQGVPWEPRPELRSRARFALRWAGAWPNVELWTAFDRTRALAAAVRRCEAAEPFDLVHLTSAEVVTVSAVARAPSALLLFDVTSRQLERERDIAASRARRVRYALEAARSAAWERRWFRRPEGLACVSDVDAAVVEGLTGRRVSVVPNPVPEAFFEPPGRARSSADVVIVAHLGYRPNVDAVCWFSTEVWPLVREAVPAARLVVAGSRPDPDVVAAVAAAGGELHADVDDVRPYYWRAAVCVSPIRLGSGLRNKVLHAIACGAPVVATTTAIEGIDVRPGEHLLVGDDTRTLAHGVIASLVDPAASARRAAAAAPLVEAFRSAAVADQLERWWLATAGVSAVDVGPAASPRRPGTDAPSEDLTMTVVICTRDRPDLLARTLPVVARAVERVAGSELIVVVQGDPAVAALARSICPGASVVEDDGVGAARARNIGARLATGDVLLFTDDDCEVPPDWLVDHRAAFRHRSVVATCGEVRGMTRYAASGAAAAEDPAARRAVHGPESPPWRVGHSANLAVRREALLELGGFDERLGPGTPGGFIGEDADLLARLLARGGQVVAAIGEPVVHVRWRSADEDGDNLVGYELGAGAWLGKALRARGRSAVPLIRARGRMLWKRAVHEGGLRTSPVGTARSAAGFLRGLVHGWRLGSWP